MPRLLSIQKGSSRSRKAPVENYRKCLDIFYQYLKESGKTLKDISARHMVPFLIELEQHYQTADVDLIIAEMRVFFNFFASISLLSDNRQQPWMSILQSRSIEPTENTLSIFRSGNRAANCYRPGSPVGKTNYAMILLAARYGLRLSDVISLRFCNIDWPDNQYRPDTANPTKRENFPLSEEVGNAIIDYLKYSRPESKEPYVPHRYCALLSAIKNLPLRQSHYRVYGKSGYKL